jgi:hypothetical protein
MRHRELKVGMNIIGKPNNGYAITNQYTICKVLKVNGLNERIFVEVIQSNDNNRVGTRWEVDYKRFVKANVDIQDTKDKIPIPFPVGSYIVGNSKNEYGQTRYGCVCKVMGYKDYLYNERLGLDSEYMRVKIVDKDGTLRESTYTVRPSWFDACDFKPYNGLFSKAYYKKLFTISDDSIKVDGVNKDSPCYSQLVKECVDNGLMKKGE